MTNEDATVGGLVLAALTAAGAALRWLWTRRTSSRVELAQAVEAEAALVDRPFREAWKLIDRLTTDIERETAKRLALEQKIDDEMLRRRSLAEEVQALKQEVRTLQNELREAEETIADLGLELGRAKRKVHPST